MDEYVKKSAVLQMLHEAYADDVIDTKDGCKALYKRLNDMPKANVDFLSRTELLNYIDDQIEQCRENKQGIATETVLEVFKRCIKTFPSKPIKG